MILSQENINLVKLRCLIEMIDKHFFEYNIFYQLTYLTLCTSVCKEEFARAIDYSYFVHI